MFIIGGNEGFENVSRYQPAEDLVPHSAVKECVSQVEYLLKQVHYWVSTHYPDLTLG